MTEVNLGEVTEVEAAIGVLYVAFFRLRQAGKFQEEYDDMGALITMLTQDREHLRNKIPKEKW